MGCNNGTLLVLDLANGKEKTIKLPTDRKIVTIKVGNGDRTVFVGCYNGEVHSVSLESGKINWSFRGEGNYHERNGRLSLLVHAAQPVVLVGGANNRIAFVDAVTGDLIHSVRIHGGGVTCLAMSPTGRYIAAGSSDGGVCVWELRRLLEAGNARNQGGG
jgi:WD40 repeat protein